MQSRKQHNTKNEKKQAKTMNQKSRKCNKDKKNVNNFITGRNSQTNSLVQIHNINMSFEQFKILSAIVLLFV